jgi:hypothetical protein
MSVELRGTKPLTLREWTLFVFLDLLTPWLCLTVGFVVAFQRPVDPLAWLLLLLMMSFGSLAQAGFVVAIVAGWEPPTRPLAMFYYLTISNSWGFWMLLFGQYFPDRSTGGRWNRSIRWGGRRRACVLRAVVGRIERAGH